MKTNKIRKELDKKIGKKVVEIGKDMKGKPFSNWEKKKIKFILGV